MMVEKCIKNDEVEDGSFYNTLCDECDEETLMMKMSLMVRGMKIVLSTDMTNPRW